MTKNTLHIKQLNATVELPQGEVIRVFDWRFTGSKNLCLLYAWSGQKYWVRDGKLEWVQNYQI